MQGFRHDAHPMGMLVGSGSAPCRRSTRTPRTSATPPVRDIQTDPADREDADARRLLLPAHAMGQAVQLPRQRPSGYAGNFLFMMYKMTEL